jgi:5-formyltetrahydrofolate cyclo-ligase
MTPPEAKAELRRELRARLQPLTAAERAAQTEQICRRLPQQEFWKTAKTVLLFAPLPDEVNIWPLLELALAEGKTVTLPRYDPVNKNYTPAQVTDLTQDLVTAAFGIREPAPSRPEVPLAQIALALIPGVGFDQRGRRLGRGRGFYDRLLAGFTGLKCGLAFAEQIALEIPTEEHDIRMDVVFT